MIDYIETITSDVEAEICFQNHQARLKDLQTEEETLEQIIKHYTDKLKDVIERTYKEFDNCEECIFCECGGTKDPRKDNNNE